MLYCNMILDVLPALHWLTRLRKLFVCLQPVDFTEHICRHSMSLELDTLSRPAHDIARIYVCILPRLLLRLCTDVFYLWAGHALLARLDHRKILSISQRKQMATPSSSKSVLLVIDIGAIWNTVVEGFGHLSFVMPLPTSHPLSFLSIRFENAAFRVAQCIPNTKTKSAAAFRIVVRRASRATVLRTSLFSSTSFCVLKHSLHYSPACTLFVLSIRYPATSTERDGKIAQGNSSCCVKKVNIMVFVIVMNNWGSTNRCDNKDR